MHRFNFHTHFFAGNKFKMLLMEQSGKGLTEERMVLVFQALDELVPKLGVYQRIFQRLRDDLFGMFIPAKQILMHISVNTGI